MTMMLLFALFNLLMMTVKVLHVEDASCIFIASLYLAFIFIRPSSRTQRPATNRSKDTAIQTQPGPVRHRFVRARLMETVAVPQQPLSALFM